MKRLVPLYLFALACLAVTPLLAMAAPATKIGYVDLERALNEVEDGKKAKEKLKTVFDDRQKKLNKEVESFKKKKEEFDKRAPLLKPEAKEKEERELERQFIEVQSLAAQLQQEIAAEEAKLTKPIFDRFAKIIQSLGESGSYALILEKNQSALLYAPSSSDVTNELIRNYNDGKGK